MFLIRVQLPAHLRTLAGVQSPEVAVEIQESATQRSVLDALEAEYPALQGTVREHASGRRRAYLRFFACGRDLSLEEPEAPLPEEVARGEEPFLVVGAIAGG